MPKRRPRKTVKQPPAKRGRGSYYNDINVEEPQEEKGICSSFSDREVEHQIAATHAIRDAEIEHLLTVLRLLRSNFMEDQLKTPILQFFKENMPNLAVKISDKDGGGFEVAWKDKDGNSSSRHADQRNMHASLLQRTHIEYPDSSAVPTIVAGFEFASKAAKKNLFGAADLNTPNSVVEEHLECQMLGLQDALGTPGVMVTQGLTVGMIPKIQRHPKSGEMLLSVHGSPLGVYKEDTMEVIREFEDD